MPRKRLPVSNEYPYHVSVRANNQDWFALPMDTMWDIFSNALYLTKACFDINIHAFVMMSNHFHLLVSTPQANLAQAMQYFIRETSKEISRRADRKNHNFKQSYFRSLIKDENHLLTVYKYIYQNPMRAKISKKAHHYKYSTLNQLVGLRHGMIPVNDDILFSGEDWIRNLDWINTPNGVEMDLAIKNGLRRSEFEPAIDRTTRRKQIAEVRH